MLTPTTFPLRSTTGPPQSTGFKTVSCWTTAGEVVRPRAHANAQAVHGRGEFRQSDGQFKGLLAALDGEPDDFTGPMPAQQAAHFRHGLGRFRVDVDDDVAGLQPGRGGGTFRHHRLDLGGAGPCRGAGRR